MQSSTSTDRQQAAIAYVVAEFGKHTGREAVVRSTAEQFGCGWAEAESFVEFVEREYGGKVARRQGWLLIPIGVGTLILGLLLTLFTGWVLYQQMRGHATVGRGEGRVVYGFFIGLMMMGGAGMGLWQHMRAMARR
jgi:hypothetical protein